MEAYDSPVQQGVNKYFFLEPVHVVAGYMWVPVKHIIISSIAEAFSFPGQ